MFSSGNFESSFLFSANISAFICGTAFGWTSPEIPKLSNATYEQNPLSSNPLTKDQETWIGSLLPVGACIGPFLAGFLVNRFGRKRLLLATAIPFILAFLMCAYAKSAAVFMVSRFIIGLAIGAVFTVLPMYIGEISEDSVRGALGSLMQLFITFGLVFSYALGPYTTIVHFNLACVIPVLLFIFSFIYIPESPYYLIADNDKEAAENSLKKLRASENVDKELDAIKKSVEESLSDKASFFDIFKSKGLTKALIISVGLVAFQQFSGINVILFYTQTIFQATGSTIKPEISTIIIGIVQIFGSMITPVLVDKRGKRFLLILSAIGMTISEATLGYYFFMLQTKQDVSSISWLPVLCLVSYMITYCFGFGPLPWAVMGELFPANIKSSASTVTASGCWVLAFFLTKYFSAVCEVIGKAGSFWFFSCCCAIAGGFVYKFVPETSGKSLQEIQDILAGVRR